MASEKEHLRFMAKAALVIFITIFSSLAGAKPFVGGMLNIGQCGAGSTGSLAMDYGLEAGTTVSISPFRHIQFGMEALKSLCDYRDSNDASVTLDLVNIILKGGYGQAFTDNLLITYFIGVGPAQGNYSATQNNVTISSSKQIVGVTAEVGAEAQLQIAENLYGVGAFSFRHSQLNVSSVKFDPANSTLNRSDYEKAINANIPLITAGIRVGF